METKETTHQARVVTIEKKESTIERMKNTVLFWGFIFLVRRVLGRGGGSRGRGVVDEGMGPNEGCGCLAVSIRSSVYKSQNKRSSKGHTTSKKESK